MYPVITYIYVKPKMSVRPCHVALPCSFIFLEETLVHLCAYTITFTQVCVCVCLSIHVHVCRYSDITINGISMDLFVTCVFVSGIVVD